MFKFGKAVSVALVCFSVVLFSSSASAQNQDSGLYVGVVTGLGEGSLSSADDVIETAPGGHILGGRLGVNKVIRAWFVGAEADLVQSRIDGKESITNGGFETAFDADHSMLTTLRARIGRDLGRAVIYGTGGLAVARVTASVSVTDPTGARLGNQAVDNATHAGWALGAGLELPISRRVSFTGEYLRVDFPAESMTFDIGIHAQPMVEDAHFDMNVLRVGVNIRF